MNQSNQNFQKPFGTPSNLNKNQINQFSAPVQMNNQNLLGAPLNYTNSFINGKDLFNLASSLNQQQAPINFQQPMFQYQQAPQQFIPMQV